MTCKWSHLFVGNLEIHEEYIVLDMPNSWIYIDNLIMSFMRPMSHIAIRMFILIKTVLDPCPSQGDVHTTQVLREFKSTKEEQR